MSETIRNFTLKPVLPTRFVVMNDRNEYPGVRENCTLEVLREKLADLDGLEIVSVDYNGEGWYKEEGMFFGFFEHTAEKELPPYFIVNMKKKMPGDHVANMTAFLPTIWNERFFGVTGGGSASFLNYQQHLFAMNTPWTVAVRNHFACVQTDCEIDFLDTDWGFKKDSTELDYDLIHYWGHIGAHDVAVIGKRIVEAVYGRKPAYSYAMGISAGGRTSLGEAQRYPDDYDGIWANCPAVPWVLHLLSQNWPYIVMVSENHFLHIEKVHAFHNAMLKKYGFEGQPYQTAVFFPEFDPYTLVGTETARGVITEKDAFVAKKIYDGPVYRDGRRMYDCDPMGPNVRFEQLLTYAEDGSRPITSISMTSLQAFRWALADPDLTFDEIGYEKAEKIYEFGAGTFRDTDNKNPDLRRFRDAGRKLILTHASSDYCCPLRTTLRYYNNVVRVTAGCSEEEASKFVKCYVSHGGGHGDVQNVGEIMAYPDTFIALVKWVEEGIEPGDLPAQKFDFEKGEVVYSGRIEKAYSISNPENAKVME